MIRVPSEGGKGFLLDRLDRYLLVNHPVLWSHLPLRAAPIVGSFATLALACLGASVFPVQTVDIWSRTAIALVVALGIFLVMMLSSAVIDARRTAADKSRDEKHAVPEHEGFQLSLPHWALLAGRAVLVSIPFIVSFPILKSIVHKRTASAVESSHLIADLNAINTGLGSCCVLQPMSEACLKRRPIPMATQQLTSLKAARAEFLDPTRLPLTPAADHSSHIAALEQAIRRYSPVDDSGTEPSLYQLRLAGKRKDLDRLFQSDSRTPTQKTCAEISSRDLRVADLNISRILAAKGLTPSSPLENRYWPVDAILLALLLVVLADLNVVGASVVGVFLGVLSGFAESVARNVGFDIRYVFWSFPAMAAIGGYRIATGYRPWLSDLTYEGGASVVAFPVFVVATRALSGLGVFGHLIDLTLIAAIFILAWRFRSRIMRDIIGESARPKI